MAGPNSDGWNSRVVAEARSKYCDIHSDGIVGIHWVEWSEKEVAEAGEHS